MSSHRTTSPRLRLALGLSLALSAGCQEASHHAEPEPVDPAPAVEAPAPAPEPTPEPAPTPMVEAPAPRAEPTRIVITSKSFPQELLDRIRLDDLVEVELARGGGRTRGAVKVLRPGELAVAIEGTQIVTRLKPDDVRDVRLLFRDDQRADLSGADEPRTEQEGWLERFAARSVLEGDAAALWGGRFDANVALPVVRSFTMSGLIYAGARQGAAAFTPSPQRTTLREGELLKLVGAVQGVLEQRGGADRPLGEVQLYLVKRGGQVQALYSTEHLHASNLERAAVMRFLEREPVTLAACKVGRDRRYVRIVRVPAKTARTYMMHLERTPERTALRAWRAQGNPGLEAAEKSVRALYKAVGLTGDADLETPVLFELHTTSATGGLRLLGFSKELGME
ncbi:MAG: hypothetical protein KF878_12365 [Planctomycetes bacterium]|nr:hypothetical protein [Planctomycetota bacterium]